MPARLAPIAGGERAARIAATLLLALAAGWLFARARAPLPWILGPLLVTAALSVAGVRLEASNRLRNAGQWLIGVVLGLYFTPEVVVLLLKLAPALAAGVAWALLMGYGFYRLLLRTNRDMGGDRAGAFFAAAIGGASEMAMLAERHGGGVERVAAAHSLRVLLVVVLIPFAYQALGVHGADVAVPAMQVVHLPGLALLLAASAAGMWVFRRLDVPNPWVLGALTVTAVLSATGLQLSALPREAGQAAQLFIGVALGTRFSPAFLRAAPRWMASVAAGTLAMIGASGVFAAAVAWLAGLHPATVLLGMSPGGIAEMCLTAHALQLGVPVVTAFHVTRYVAVVTLTSPLYRWELRRAAAAR